MTDQRPPHPTIPVPSVGRVVWYWAYGTPGGEYPARVARAAIVTLVRDPGNPQSSVGLCVLNPTGQFFNVNVPFTYEDEPGCWSQPTYQPPIVKE